MTPERAEQIRRGVGQSILENAGKLIVPIDVLEELQRAGLILPSGDLDMLGLSALARKEAEDPPA
jgi:hypothetical protein